MMSRLTGKVKFFNHARGFGFIGPDAAGPDIFVHATALPEGMEVREGDRVSFEVGDDRRGKGKQAANVKFDSESDMRLNGWAGIGIVLSVLWALGTRCVFSAHLAFES